MAKLVEHWTGDGMVASLRLIGVTVCPSVRHFIHCLVLVQPRKTEKCPNMTEKVLTGT